MPLYHKKEFEPQRVPDGLKPDDKVFFLPLTKEVFTSYDAFFHRLVALNSLVWTCSVTGKAGLTFEEALKSEKDAQETLESFPEYLETPILYLVKEYTMRGRLDDVVNDIYDFMRNRFFVGEEVSYFGEGRRKRVRILSVSYSGPEFTTSTFPGTNSVPNEKTKKRGELLIGESKNYSYTVQIIDADGGESDSGVREHVENDQLLRPKSSSSRAKLKLLLKNSCFLDTNRINVKKSLVTSNQLESVRWTDIFGGPMAVFPQTPAASRGRNNTAKTVTKETLSNNELDEVLVQNANGETASENTTPTKKKRGRPKGSTSSAKKEGDETNTTLPEDPEEKRRRKIEEKVDKKMKKIEKERLVKQKKEIAKQQEELQSLFQKARRVGVADVSAWEQKEKLLSAEDIAELRQAIKTAREQVRFVSTILISQGLYH
ncbi:hypothetical protein AB6A40_007034 [Gnathostoma spinigerum]|uniref:WAC domain-containing protein n=1 Tax=Gnathostoma spinigerum TaxID=75299 RepID=A0ABD6EVP4_9BILA